MFTILSYVNANISIAGRPHIPCVQFHLNPGLLNSTLSRSYCYRLGSGPNRTENCWAFWFPQHIHQGNGEAEDLHQITLEVESQLPTEPDRRPSVPI